MCKCTTYRCVVGARVVPKLSMEWIWFCVAVRYCVGAHVYCFMFDGGKRSYHEWSLQWELSSCCAAVPAMCQVSPDVRDGRGCSEAGRIDMAMVHRPQCNRTHSSVSFFNIGWSTGVCGSGISQESLFQSCVQTRSYVLYVAKRSSGRLAQTSVLVCECFVL